MTADWNTTNIAKSSRWIRIRYVCVQLANGVCLLGRAAIAVRITKHRKSEEFERCRAVWRTLEVQVHLRQRS